MMSGFGRARCGQRGAAAVEAAIITPVLMLMVFGIIEFGFLFKDWLAVTSSVRAGARIASAEPRYVGFADDAKNQVAKEGSALSFDGNTSLWIYKAGLNGYPVGESSFASCPNTSCVKYKWNSSTKSFAKQSGSDWLAINQNACQADPNRDSLGVYLSVQNESLTSLFFDTKTLSSRTVMSLEPLPATSVETGGCKP
jgi:hypothetical protein